MRGLESRNRISAGIRSPFFLVQFVSQIYSKRVFPPLLCAPISLMRGGGQHAFYGRGMGGGVWVLDKTKHGRELKAKSLSQCEVALHAKESQGRCRPDDPSSWNDKRTAEAVDFPPRKRTPPHPPRIGRFQPAGGSQPAAFFPTPLPHQISPEFLLPPTNKGQNVKFDGWETSHK